MKNTKARNESGDHWHTPDHIYNYFMSLGFFDPCPYKSTFNGLEIEWGKYNFVNPPYNKIDKTAFIQKAFEEYKNNKNIVMLLPVSTSTKIFHDIILKYCEIIFIKGRLKFYNEDHKGKCGQHDSMFVIFSKNKKEELKTICITSQN